jgi:hypothetical protein
MIIDVLAHHVSKSVAEMLEKEVLRETSTSGRGKELSYLIRVDPHAVVAHGEMASICMP